MGEILIGKEYKICEANSQFKLVLFSLLKLMCNTKLFLPLTLSCSDKQGKCGSSCVASTIFTKSGKFFLKLLCSFRSILSGLNLVRPNFVVVH